MVQAEVREHNGAPALFLDGKPVVYHGLHFSRHTIQKYEPLLAIGGYRFGQIAAGKYWTGPGQYDFSDFDTQVTDALENHPDNFYWVDVALDPPGWWLRSHPEELQLHHDQRDTGQSIASALWLRDGGAALQALIRHINRSPLNDRLFTYCLAAAHTGEWFYIGGPLRYQTDRSEPMLAAFRSWLRRRYASVAELRAAWAEADVDFETASIPSRFEELQTDIGSFRDPRMRRRIVDFFTFYNEAMADAAIHFARIAKETIVGRKLVGLLYGHILDWIGNPYMAQHIGHLALSKVLDCPYIDWLGGPNSYHKRSVGFDDFFVSVENSVHLHNKLWLPQCDVRTHHCRPELEICGERAPTLPDSIAVVRRSFSRSLCRSTELWWLELFPGWFDDPEIIQLLLKSRAIAATALQSDRRTGAEVAVIVDEQSHFYQGLRDVPVVDTFISPEVRACDVLTRMGLPYDIYLSSDLSHPKLQEYKVYIFPQWYAIDERGRKTLLSLRAGGRVFVWLYAPGFVTPDVGRCGLSVEGMEEATGIRFELLNIAAEDMIRITNFDHPVTGGRLDFGIIYAGWVFSGFRHHFGTHRAVAPLFAVNDPKAVALGRYTFEPFVGFAAKDMGDWRSVYFGTPFAPSCLLRNIARWAGAHIYSESDDLFFANRSFVALHTIGAGDRTISLPEPCDVYDVFDDRFVATDSSSFTIRCQARSTRLFQLLHK